MKKWMVFALVLVIKINDAATGWENVLHGTEITLDAELASKAEAWALKQFLIRKDFRRLA